MNSSPQSPKSLPRKYSRNSSFYTPLDTASTPRPGRTNDIAYLSESVIGVVLQDSSVAMVDDLDYWLLQARGWNARWTARKVTGDNHYPSINNGDSIRTIARVILDAKDRERISYRDGNQLNLRRANLVLKVKGGREIGHSLRSCPQAPILSVAEQSRSLAAVAYAVGSASPADRVATAERAVSRALPAILSLRADSVGARS